MAAPNKLPEIAEEYGKPLDVLIPELVEQEGAISRAAAKLGVNTNTINNWMKTNGFKSETRQVTRLVRIQPKG